MAATLVAVALSFQGIYGAETPSPLRLIPEDVDLVVRVPQVRRAAVDVTQLEVIHKLEALSAFREVIGSTRFRHFRQFVSYYEKEMGAPWPEILDEIAGGGIAFGVKVGKQKGPALLVVQGRDEPAVQKFARISLHILNEEAARADEKAGLTKGSHRGVETLHFGDDLRAAVLGSAILFSNDEALLKSAIDLHAGGGGKSCLDKPAVQEAAKLVPQDALATLYFNLETVRKDPNAAAVLKAGPRDDPALTILVGGYLDIIGRSPYVAAALCHDADGFSINVRLPKGRKGMGPDSLLHVPPADSATAGRPLLEPKGVLFSTCFYMDVARIWQDRNKIFTEKVAKSFEKANKDTNPFLAALRIGKTLPMVGTRHRLVVACQPDSAYKAASGVPIPAFAVVTELKQPEEFGQTVEAALRGGALLAGFKFNLQLAEEKVGDVTLVGYRFGEKQGDLGDFDAKFLRYYSPCFARVGDQFLVCSTIELGRELIRTLQTEKKIDGGVAVSTRLYGTGAADFLQSIEETLVSQAVLDRALTLDQAAAEVKAGLAMLRSFGPMNVSVRYDDERFNYDFRLKGLK
jgi:hypothetical protein